MTKTNFTKTNSSKMKTKIWCFKKSEEVIYSVKFIKNYCNNILKLDTVWPKSIILKFGVIINFHSFAASVLFHCLFAPGQHFIDFPFQLLHRFEVNRLFCALRLNVLLTSLFQSDNIGFFFGIGLNPFRREPSRL